MLAHHVHSVQFGRAQDYCGFVATRIAELLHGPCAFVKARAAIPRTKVAQCRGTCIRTTSSPTHHRTQHIDQRRHQQSIITHLHRHGMSRTAHGQTQPRRQRTRNAYIPDTTNETTGRRSNRPMRRCRCAVVRHACMEGCTRARTHAISWSY